jgi:hypothetical protein
MLTIARDDERLHSEYSPEPLDRAIPISDTQQRRRQGHLVKD